MARDVEADVNINDKSSRGLGSFLAGLRKADAAAKGTQRGIDDAAKSTAKLSKETEQNAKAFSKLSKELEVSKKELGSLARAFAEAGDAAERSDISKAMAKQQTEIRKLTKNRDILKDLLPSEQEVKQEVQKLTPSFGKQFSELFSSAGELAVPALVIGIAAAAPAIGAVISGAIIGGVGIGGIAGGLALAARDPAVEAAGKGFAQRIEQRLTDAAKPFVPVAVDGIHQIENALDGINFEGLFSDAAKQAGPLIGGIAEAVKALGHGVTDLIHNSGPAVKAIGDGIAGFGHAIGDGLESLADNGPEGADALRNIFTIIDGGTRLVFGFVNALTETYGWLRRIGGPGVVDALNAIGDAQTLVSGYAAATVQAAVSTNQATDSIDQFGQKTLTSGDALQTLSDKVSALAAAGHAAFDSTTQLGAAVDAVSASARKNGKTLDANTEKGRANRDVLSGVANSLLNVYKASIDANDSQEQSNAIAGRNRAQFIKLATQLGATTSQARAFADQFGLIPAKKTTELTANTHDAQARIKALQEQFDALHGKTVSVHVSVTGLERLNAAGHRLGGALSAGQSWFPAGGTFDAMRYFAAAGAGGGTRRTGGPLPVDVFAAVTSNLYLDGSLIYANTAAQVRASSRRDAWRQKVGRR